ncbi:hypothetical protein [Salinicoccus roseus]
MKNDVYYVKNLSLIFDVLIIIKTIFSVLSKKNVYTDENKSEEFSTDFK